MEIGAKGTPSSIRSNLNVAESIPVTTGQCLSSKMKEQLVVPGGTQSVMVSGSANKIAGGHVSIGGVDV